MNKGDWVYFKDDPQLYEIKSTNETEMLALIRDGEHEIWTQKDKLKLARKINNFREGDIVRVREGVESRIEGNYSIISIEAFDDTAVATLTPNFKVATNNLVLVIPIRDDCDDIYSKMYKYISNNLWVTSTKEKVSLWLTDPKSGIDEEISVAYNE